MCCTLYVRYVKLRFTVIIITQSEHIVLSVPSIECVSNLFNFFFRLLTMFSCFMLYEHLHTITIVFFLTTQKCSFFSFISLLLFFSVFIFFFFVEWLAVSASASLLSSYFMINFVIWKDTHTPKKRDP